MKIDKFSFCKFCIVMQNSLVSLLFLESTLKWKFDIVVDILTYNMPLRVTVLTSLEIYNSFVFVSDE